MKLAPVDEFSFGHVELCLSVGHESGDVQAIVGFIGLEVRKIV